jgi:hypothetical protein
VESPTKTSPDHQPGARKDGLLRKLFYLTPATGEPIGSYLNKVLQVRNEMVELKTDMDDSIIKMMITTKLPERFHIRTHYMHDQKPEITLEDFKASLIQFEAETAIGTFIHPTAIEAHKVMVTASPTTPEKPTTSSSARHKGERPKCLGCGKIGHWMLECRQINKSNNNNSNSSPGKCCWNNHGGDKRNFDRFSEVCDYCTKDGHSQQDCNIRKKAEQLVEQKNKKSKTEQH